MASYNQFRSETPSIAQRVAADDADDLRRPITSPEMQIKILEATSLNVQSDRASEALSAAVESLQDGISELRQAADRVIDDANDAEGA
jgi:hypothetical protein